MSEARRIRAGPLCLHGWLNCTILTLDIVLATVYYVARTGGEVLAPENRTEYFRKRREKIGQLNVAVSRERLSALEEKLKGQGKTKTQWVNEKIDEELGREK